MSWFKKLFGSADAQSKPEQKPTEMQLLVFAQAEELMLIINESLQISNNSIHPSTKVSRLELARSKLDSLELLSKQHPFITLKRLDEVRKSIAGLAEEYSNAGYYVQTDSSSRDYRQDVFRNIRMRTDDLIKGLQFQATIQLRTPSRVLLRHGELHEKLTNPPIIAQENWEGGWTPVIKSLRDLGIDLPDITACGDTISSDIGPIPLNGGDYLKFLLKVRTIVERIDNIESRKILLRDELRRPEWSEFVRKLGGKQFIQSYFFPSFLDTIKGLHANSITGMWDEQLTTPARVIKASDAELLAIKGIGTAKLKLIRAACIGVQNPESEYMENIIR